MTESLCCTSETITTLLINYKVKSLSCVQLFATPWTVAYQVPPSIGFSRQGYWSGLPSPSQGDLPNPGMEPGSSALQIDALPSEPPGKPINQLLLQYKIKSKKNKMTKMITLDKVRGLKVNG